MARDRLWGAVTRLGHQLQGFVEQLTLKGKR